MWRDTEHKVFFLFRSFNVPDGSAITKEIDVFTTYLKERPNVAVVVFPRSHCRISQDQPSFLRDLTARCMCFDKVNILLRVGLARLSLHPLTAAPRGVVSAVKRKQSGDFLFWYFWIKNSQNLASLGQKYAKLSPAYSFGARNFCLGTSMDSTF